MPRFKTFTFALLAVMLTGSGISLAGDLFLQFRSARSRRCIPAYDYRTSRSEATTAVTSLGPVPLVKGNPAANEVVEKSRLFVLPNAQAGPIRLTDLAAKTFPESGRVVVTGVLSHTGGDTGQQTGGKAVMRVDVLGGVGVEGANRPVIARRQVACWARQGEPKTIQIPVQCTEFNLTEIERVGRIRLFLEYHPNR